MLAFLNYNDSKSTEHGEMQEHTATDWAYVLLDIINNCNINTEKTIVNTGEHIQMSAASQHSEAQIHKP